MSTRQACYHCKQAFDAQEYDRTVDPWICPDCGKNLVGAGVMEDELDSNGETSSNRISGMLTKPIRNLESLEVTFSTVFIAMSGYFFFYLANGLQKYDFEMGLDLSGYVTLVMITGIFFVSWASYIIYGGFLHLAAKVMGGTGKFNLTATALGHAVLLPSLIGVIIGFFWVYTGTTDPLIASSITCGILIVTSSIVAIKVVNELSWGRAIAAYALLPITTVVLGFALFYLTFLN